MADLNNHKSIFVDNILFILISVSFYLTHPCKHVGLILITNFYYQIPNWCNLLSYKYKLRCNCNNIVFVVQHIGRGQIKFL